MSGMSEVVVEKTMGKYRLPDNAVDLEEWLRDGLDVYNLFIFMKPLFFQMLEALGGEFRGSGRKASDERGLRRLTIREEDVNGKPGDEGWDRLMVATLSGGEPRDPDLSALRALLLDIWCRPEVTAAMLSEMRARVERVVSPATEEAGH